MGRPERVGTVVDRLLLELAHETWPAGSHLAPVRRLASDFGVSVGTAQAAVKRLGNRGILEVRERHPVRIPLDAAKRARELLAPSLRAGAPRRIAILVSPRAHPSQRNPFYTTLLRSITSEAQRQGLRTSVVLWPVKEQLAAAEALLRADYDAALVLGLASPCLPSLCLLSQRKFPLAVFNHEIPGLNLPTVIEDLYGAVQHMADHLVQLGHRNLCLVAHPGNSEEMAPDAPPRRGIVRGWGDYLADHQLLESCTMPVYVPWPWRYRPDFRGPHTDLYDPVFKRLLRSPERPTAIVFPHSPWAEEFLRDADFARLKVPAEISLATFESTANMPSVPWCPPLTNLEIDHRRAAQCLIETLQKMLRGVLRPPTIRVPLDLNTTESIGPAPWSAAAEALVGRAHL